MPEEVEYVEGAYPPPLEKEIIESLAVSNKL
jgi:hypothetical protein